MMSNSQYLFKYLPRNFAERLFFEGEVHFKHAAYFCSLEDDGKRGDQHDGQNITTSPIVVDGETIYTKSYSVRSQEELRTTYIFCVAKTSSPDFFEAFDADSCVVIRDVEKFKNRITRLATNICLDLQKRFSLSRSDEVKMVDINVSYPATMISGDVRYIDEDRVEEIQSISANIQHKFFSKRKTLYERQNEYRFLLEPKGNISLSVSNDVDSVILKSFLQHYSAYDLFPVGMNIHIGNIEDIAEIEFK